MLINITSQILLLHDNVSELQKEKSQNSQDARKYKSKLIAIVDSALSKMKIHIKNFKKWNTVNVCFFFVFFFFKSSL